MNARRATPWVAGLLAVVGLRAYTRHARQLAEALEMGYVGVDFVLDATVGPVVLEANARPGLAIQVANRCGLAHRLDFFDAQPPEAFAPAWRAKLVAALSEMK